MIAHIANRRRSRDETILVVMPAGIVEVGNEIELAGVTFSNQVLPINVGGQDLLFAPLIDRVQIGIRILLQHVEGSDVPLPFIVVVVAENAPSQICVFKN